jgi:hypothetical protein
MNPSDTPARAIVRRVPLLLSCAMLVCLSSVSCGFLAGPAFAAGGSAPTKVVATPWPYTALVSFSPPTQVPPGTTIVSYKVVAVDAPWIGGKGPTSPIMVYGGGTKWAGLSYRFQVSAVYSDGTTSPLSAPSNPVTPSGGASAVVYANGMFYWEGDFSYDGTIVYADTTGNPVGGAYDLMFMSTAQGAWQPSSPGANFDLRPYRYLQFDLKPTREDQTWTIYFELVGDRLTGKTAVVPSDRYGTYGPPPVVGQWTTYKVPLDHMNVGPGTANLSTYKFGIKDDRKGNDVWYVNNVKFTAE